MANFYTTLVLTPLTIFDVYFIFKENGSLPTSLTIIFEIGWSWNRVPGISIVFYHRFTGIFRAQMFTYLITQWHVCHTSLSHKKRRFSFFPLSYYKTKTARNITLLTVKHRQQKLNPPPPPLFEGQKNTGVTSCYYNWVT